MLRRDQIRENVLSNQYYCDVDIAHLIAFNEHLAHRLNNEPAEIIPVVGNTNTIFVKRELKGCVVRSRAQDMHTTNPLSVSQRRGQGTRQSTTPTPTAHPLLCFADINSRPHGHQRLAPRPHTRYCHRCQYTQLESDRFAHPMPKLRVYGNTAHHIRLYRCHASKNMWETEQGVRCRG